MRVLIKDKSINPDSVDVLLENTSEIIELKKKFSESEQIKEISSFEDLITKNQDVK